MPELRKPDPRQISSAWRPKFQHDDPRATDMERWLRWNGLWVDLGEVSSSNPRFRYGLMASQAGTLIQSRTAFAYAVYIVLEPVAIVMEQAWPGTGPIVERLRSWIWRCRVISKCEDREGGFQLIVQELRERPVTTDTQIAIRNYLCGGGEHDPPGFLEHELLPELNRVQRQTKWRRSSMPGVLDALCSIVPDVLYLQGYEMDTEAEDGVSGNTIMAAWLLERLRASPLGEAPKVGEVSGLPYRRVQSRRRVLTPGKLQESLMPHQPAQTPDLTAMSWVLGDMDAATQFRLARVLLEFILARRTSEPGSEAEEESGVVESLDVVRRLLDRAANEAADRDNVDGPAIWTEVVENMPSAAWELFDMDEPVGPEELAHRLALDASYVHDLIHDPSIENLFVTARAVVALLKYPRGTNAGWWLTALNSALRGTDATETELLSRLEAALAGQYTDTLAWLQRMQDTDTVGARESRDLGPDYRIHAEGGSTRLTPDWIPAPRASVWAPDVPGFVYLGEHTFSCFNDEEGLKVFTVPVYRNIRFAEAAGVRLDAPIQDRSNARILTADTEFVLLPLGHHASFLMGSPPRDRLTRDEQPQHEVRFEHRFLIARTPVTQRVWAKLAGGLDPYPSYFEAEERPVERVSWDDCVQWCSINGLRLPSEAEWEFSCRAGTKTRYFFGNNPNRLTNFAWYDVNAEYATHPVAILATNAFGLFDTHGNIWELCADEWHDNYKGAPADGSVWGTEADASCVDRGGSWSDNELACRSAARDHWMPQRMMDYDNNLGFRPVITV